MWSKLSHALKSRSEITSPIPEEDTNSATGEVVSRVKELHPNMSVFHQDDTEVPFPTPSPPASPTLSRRSMLKRLSKLPQNDSTDALPKPGNPKKVKSSLASINTASDTSSLSRASGELLARPSFDSVRTPVTPVAEKNGESKFGSLRSILKPNNTPGTGQSVRFFSRDAYKVMTPEQSSASELEDTCLMSRVPRNSSSRPSLQAVFSAPPPPPEDSSPLPPDVDSLVLPAPPPNTSNIFDMSSMELPTIPVGFNAPLLDSAVEIETDDQLSMSLDGSLGSIESQPKQDRPEDGSVVGSPTIKLGPALHDRSQSFSFGQTIFRSTANAESSPAMKAQSAHRSRALSDTVFTSMLHSPLAAVIESKEPKRPEADINDPSQAIVAYQQRALSPPPPNDKERDPFAANATTYYTPGMMLPPSPPQSTHTRKASREEDIIWSLRTQLALQSELCAQYEVDLSAKDEMVECLTGRLSETEKELERRKGTIRNWRKRVAELEKCLRGLEEEVDRSREVSMERSVMDEASGEALRMLHRQISQLEKEESDQRGPQASRGRNLYCRWHGRALAIGRRHARRAERWRWRACSPDEQSTAKETQQDSDEDERARDRTDERGRTKRLAEIEEDMLRRGVVGRRSGIRRPSPTLL